MPKGMETASGQWKTLRTARPAQTRTPISATRSGHAWFEYGITGAVESTKTTSTGASCGELGFDFLLQTREQRTIQLVTLPVLESRSLAFGVEHTKRSAEIPQSPAGI